MPNELATAAIDALASGGDLSEAQSAEVLGEIMDGNVSEVQIAAFLIALRTKGETVAELAGLARTMRSLATPVRAENERLLDTAGTGGGRRTFNVSTTAALIAAGAGCVVAKHGNRSATSLCGSADLLEALGARIDLDAEAVAGCIADCGFGFMFAPLHHRATRYVVPVRAELAVRTIFNLLGPLTNPAGARHQLIGVADSRFLEVMAGALAALGSERALLVSGEDGIDEISVFAPTRVVELAGGQLRSYVLATDQLGLPERLRQEVAQAPEREGATLAQNAQRTLAILDSERRTAAAAEGASLALDRALAAVNAGAAIYVAGGAGSIAEGTSAALEALDSGRAAAALNDFVAASRSRGRESDARAGLPGR